MKYTEALEKLNKPRKQDSKVIGNNTRLIRHSDYIGVQLHDTEVVKIYPEHYILNTGGWKTVTTKARINQYSPARVYQRNHIWYVEDSLFYDGMQVNQEGQPVKPRQATEKQAAKHKKLLKDIKKYAAAYLVALEAGELGTPSAGDCWHCAFTAEDNKTLGDLLGNHEHLQQHIEEGYLVPTLVYNAITEAGYKHPGLVWAGGQVFIDPVPSIEKYLVKRLLKGSK